MISVIRIKVDATAFYTKSPAKQRAKSQATHPNPLHDSTLAPEE